MTRLSFKNPFRSIHEFPPIQLPDFTVITGVNGTGKTHLLNAIVERAILVDVVSDPKEDVRLFDWNTLVPNDPGAFNIVSLYEIRDQFLQLADSASQRHIDKLNRWGDKYGVRERRKLTLLRQGKEYLSTAIYNPSQADEAWAQLEAIGQEIYTKMRADVHSDPLRSKHLDGLKSEIGLGVVAPEYGDFTDDLFGSSPVEWFRQSFGRLFLAYFELVNQNRIRKLQEQDGETPEAPSLSHEDFVAKYNEPPWDFVNDVLCSAGLDFDVDHPQGITTTSFAPRLMKISSGAEIKFGDLSSGEKILMSFALCLYHSLDTRQEVVFPKLLLFDEIDAPLHPSMARQLVNTIQDALVEKQGVKVILTTHSPSTVAVCPEESLYVMLPNKAGLHKSGKRQAISALTSEIPTLSISFSGQRQVFVESQIDAELLGKSYHALSSELGSERSLAFIGVGGRTPKGDANSGCEQVRRIVSTLAKQGNESVFGLIDWDSNNKTEGRVFVLAEGSRYAIENCLLDPLLVAAVAVSVNLKSMGPLVGLAVGEGLTHLSNMDQPKCQAIVDAVQERILGKTGGEKVVVNYLGGLRANVTRQYLTMNGHELEQKVKDAFPVLKKFHNPVALLKHVIDQVLAEHSGLAPIELKQAFQNILQYELHDS